MANYDNSQYTYAQVYAGTGYFQKDDLNRYSAGVLELQQKMNYVGFWCGTPDGKFGSNTEVAVRQFQRAYVGTVNGKVAQSTLVQLEQKYAASNGFTLTSGTYGVYFDFQGKKFMYSQQIFYQTLKNAGYNNYAIAGFMGNFQLESGFNPRWAGSGGSVGIAQWLGSRKTNLNNYVNSIYGDRENANEQAAFMLMELTAGSSYYRSDSGTLNNYLNDTSIVSDAEKATDYIARFYEDCEHHATWAEVLQTGYSNRFDQSSPSAYDNGFYIDIAQRRGFAVSYYNCLITIP